MSKPDKSLTDFWPRTWGEILSPPSHQPLLPHEAVLPDEARGRHGVVLGASGTGKSKLLEMLLTVDAARRAKGFSRRGVAVIDVHRDLYRHCRARLALMARHLPKLEGLVYLIDPTNLRSPVKWNPLELAPGDVPERKADMLARTVTTIYHDDPQVVVRMYRIAWHAFLTLMLAGLTLLELPRLLTDRVFREGLVSHLGHPALSDFWFDGFPKSERDALDRVESTLNRMQILNDPGIADMLAGASTIDFRELLDKGAIVLVNAPKAVLGDGSAYLFCALILAEFQRAAMSRTDVPEDQRTPFTLIADEFANYITDTIRQVFAESRKVKLELLLAGQELGQLELRDEALLRSVMGNVGSICSFRLDYNDAKVLARSVFTPDLDQVKHEEWMPKNWGSGFVTAYRQKTWRGLDEIWEREIRKLTELPDRLLWWKRKGHPGVRLSRTQTVLELKDLPDYELLPEALARQEEAAFRLARAPRMATPSPKRQVGHRREGGEWVVHPVDGQRPAIYLPPPSDNGQGTDTDDDTPFWSY